MLYVIYIVPMCSAPSLLAAVTVRAACVRRICLSQVYHYQNTKDHPGGSLSCGQLCKGQHSSGDQQLACPEWFLLGRQPGVSQERVSHLLPLLPGSSQTPVGRDKGQLIWLPLDQPSLSALGCEPGPRLQSPRSPLSALRECCALAIVPGDTSGHVMTRTCFGKP